LIKIANIHLTDMKKCLISCLWKAITAYFLKLYYIKWHFLTVISLNYGRNCFIKSTPAVVVRDVGMQLLQLFRLRQTLGAEGLEPRTRGSQHQGWPHSLGSLQRDHPLLTRSSSVAWRCRAPEGSENNLGQS
jgi:hypothetical protein